MEKKTEAAAADLLVRASCNLRASEKVMVAAKREANVEDRALAVSQFHREKRQWQLVVDEYIAIAKPP